MRHTTVPILSILSVALLGAPAYSGDGEVIQVIDMNALGSTDPAGLTYLPRTGDILVVDSEVDETDQYNGASAFRVSINGDLQETYDILSFTQEPTGVAYNPTTDTIFITDDDQHKIFEVRLHRGSLQLIREIDTGALGLGDEEGITADPNTGNLYVTDGNFGPGTSTVYEISLDGQIVRTFSVPERASDPEGIIYDECLDRFIIVGGPERRRIIDIDKDGNVFREYDLRGLFDEYGLITPKGITFAPSSDRRDRSDNLSIYFADYGLDEVPDGRLFELSYDQAPVFDTLDREVTLGSCDYYCEWIVTHDPDGEATAISFEGLPSFAEFHDCGDGSGFLVMRPRHGDEGEYTISVSATSDGCINPVKTETISVTVDAGNQPPSVFAGDNDEVRRRRWFEIDDAEVTDDGRPYNGYLYVEWVQDAGPGWARMSNRYSLNSSFYLSRRGWYGFWLYAYDGQYWERDYVWIYSY